MGQGNSHRQQFLARPHLRSLHRVMRRGLAEIRRTLRGIRRGLAQIRRSYRGDTTWLAGNTTQTRRDMGGYDAAWGRYDAAYDASGGEYNAAWADTTQLGGDTLAGSTQRAQYPLIKEYSLNHNMKPLII